MLSPPAPWDEATSEYTVPELPASLWVASSADPMLELDVLDAIAADALELDGLEVVRLGFLRKSPPTLMTPFLPPKSPSAT